MAEEKTELYNLDDADHATVLAALRHYQAALAGRIIPLSQVEPLATNGGTVTPLDAAGIDALCESLNHTGLSFSDVVQLIGDTSTDPYAVAAGQHDLLEEGTLEVDLPTIVSRGGDDGAYVMAWLWVSNEAAGVKPEGE
jgi:hypothetical protein